MESHVRTDYKPVAYDEPMTTISREKGENKQDGE